MNEVDNIIFQNFLSLGWEKEEAINSLQDLEVSEVAKLMTKCLYAINSEIDLPKSLPHNMSQRFRAAAKIAESIKDLGFSGDLGYQSILYSNETDLRKIFTFLIEKLPKDAPTITKEPLGKSFLIQREASRRISEVLQRPWVPPHCLNIARKYKAFSNEPVHFIQYGTSQCQPFTTSWYQCYKINSQSFTDILENKDNPGSRSCLFQLSKDKILPTLLNSHAEQVGRSLSNFEDETTDENVVEKEPSLEQSHQSIKYKNLKRSGLTDVFNEPREKEDLTNLLYFESKTESTSVIPVTPEQGKETVDQILEAKEKDAEIKLRDLSSQISQLQDGVIEVVRVCEEKEAAILDLQETVEEEETKLVREEKKLSLLAKTATLISDPMVSIEKLKNSLKASKERDEKLMNQWLEFKKPLEEDLKETKRKLENKRSKQTQIEGEISEAQRKTQCLLEDGKLKQVLLGQLKEQKSKMTKGVNRSVYTKQILDISAKVRKQKQEIQNILSETRIIQKEINSLTGKLQRTFAVVEDTSFKAASANERARPIYRSVISIHQECGALVDIIRDTASIQREIADLQQQLNSEKSKNIEDNLKKLQEDFNNLKLENAALKQKLNSQS